MTLARPGGYATLRDAHERDHSRLYGRARLHLEGPENVPLDTGERVRAHAAGRPDPALAALQFHYGRYLLIAASRPGGLPVPLQGLWNEHVRPPWNGAYTTNVNLEMSYWPAEVANLAECHRPLFDWLRQAAAGTTARDLYGLPGWTLHHNSDAWCFGLPAGEGNDDACWSFWPLAGAWLTRHLTDHHDFGGALTGEDLGVLRGAAEFCLAWLVEMPDGTLGTSPSTSPENHYRAPDGRPAAAAVSTTADRALIRDLLARTARLLPPGDPLAVRCRTARDRIPAERAGADGRLAEWATDETDTEPGHRHTTHLYGLYPGDSLGPELAAAARRALDARGPDSTGWSLAWRIALRARLRDAAGCAATVRRFLRPAGPDRSGVYPNLFCAHPPFQIDGNLGYTAGVAEMLLQSHDDLRLLPALPPDWPDGEVTGLRARGGVTVDLTWSDGVLRSVRLTATVSRRVVLRHGESRRTFHLHAGETLTYAPESLGHSASHA